MTDPLPLGPGLLTGDISPVRRRGLLCHPHPVPWLPLPGDAGPHCLPGMIVHQAFLVIGRPCPFPVRFDAAAICRVIAGTCSRFPLESPPCPPGCDSSSTGSKTCACGAPPGATRSASASSTAERREAVSRGETVDHVSRMLGLTPRTQDPAVRAWVRKKVCAHFTRKEKGDAQKETAGEQPGRRSSAAG